MGVATIECPSLSDAILRFSSMPGRIDAVLAEANVELETELRARVNAVYGPRLGKLWEVTTALHGEYGLAEARVATDDPRVRGYEFGTRPHQIVAHGGALAFQWHGAQAFYRRVQHPGTRPHNLRGQVEEALNTTARDIWSAALESALAEE